MHGDEREGAPGLPVMLVAGGLLGSSLAAALRLEGLQVVGLQSWGPSVPAKLRLLDYRVLVVEQSLAVPALGGTDLVRQVRRRRPDVGVVFLSDVDDPRVLGEHPDALPLGCRWLCRHRIVDLGELTEAIVEVAHEPRADRPDGSIRVGLTDTQMEVWRLLAAGATNRQIAEQRRVSVKSVEQAVHRLARRLGCLEAEGNARVSLARAYFELAYPDPGRSSLPA